MVGLLPLRFIFASTIADNVIVGFSDTSVYTEKGRSGVDKPQRPVDRVKERAA